MDSKDLADEGKSVNLSGQGLKILPKGHSAEDSKSVTTLKLDSNELQRLDNIDEFSSLVELSAVHNQLLRMHAVSGLPHLVRLDLSHNNILHIEGLKDLGHLKWLNLSGNNIKTIEHLHTNTLLEHLDLSENSISHISNMALLTKLKALYLHKNHISQLLHCELYLPPSLVTLTLASNNLVDLNEVSHLVHLTNLREFSITGNPCATMTGKAIGFDYRPFVLNWIMGLKVIDGHVVDDIESLKAEWLYSQGKGRHFHVGEHSALELYLAETCPLNSRSMESEQERKLRLILSKAQQHQQQLRKEPHIHSRIGGLGRGPGRGKVGRSTSAELMTRSLDPTLLDSCTMHVQDQADIRACLQQAELSLTRSLHCPELLSRSLMQSSVLLEGGGGGTSLPPMNGLGGLPGGAGAPLPADTTLVPVPESLVSPSVGQAPPVPPTPAPTPVCGPPPLNGVGVGGDSMAADKLMTIRSRAQEKREKRMDRDLEEAAIRIQKVWRGYQTRTLNRKVLSVYQHIQTLRTNQYIKKLSADMEATRAALENEHKLQILQMQTISALWNKVVSLQPYPKEEPGGVGDVKDLAETCLRLNNQVQQLQESMQEVLRCVSPGGGNVANNSSSSVAASGCISTQTEIVAVHTPQEGDTSRFPFQRPSTLPLPPHQLTNYADTLVDDVIKTTVAHNSQDAAGS
ncbi:centrosomal protein of 97 kDa isoform X3 [Nilaparvata lugens]|uniref:centrosomal protein of 97 kDa isoform X3 n=1 Tax=Nilaparvata lugens TaxID=108931 RepID=UPI00193E517D|nr:centrosomal protein of 97 kDa isoform X3 [Nilaparvata lugens]